MTPAPALEGSQTKEPERQPLTEAAILSRFARLEDELSALRVELDALKNRVWRKTRHQGAG